ncbi:MAG: PcfJ domain-containing protein [Bacteroidales bacterium]|nr:PcfJ domain-containing protein [Bacteroidales bacterium]
MQNKAIEKLKPKAPKEMGWRVNLQEMGEILVINVFYDKKIYARHGHNVKTHEFATWFAEENEWKRTKIESAIGMPLDIYGENYWHGVEYKRYEDGRWKLSSKDDKRILELIKKKWNDENSMRAISSAETEYGSSKRSSAESRRWQRVCEMMARVPDVPDDFWDWADQMISGGQNWIVKNKQSGEWKCSHCGQSVIIHERKLKDGQHMECPSCGEQVMLIKRRSSIMRQQNCILIQDINDQVSVARHFKIKEEFNPFCDSTKSMNSEEEVRLILYKGERKKPCDIYWGQWCGFDYKSNPCNKRLREGILYDRKPEEIRRALENTEYEAWAKLFGEFSKTHMPIDYNYLMVGSKNEAFVSLMEMLFRGRFWELLREESAKVSLWDYGRYCGPMHLDGKTIEEIFMISDRQKINRIRDRNGNNLMLAWMRWADDHGRVTDDNLTWLAKNKIWPSTMAEILRTMSLTQGINYLTRQRRESFQGKSIHQIIALYEDYMAMCRKLKKHMDDEMVTKPRELKRRHDEAVKEIQAREEKLQADQYSKKYKEAEAVLKTVRAKLEWKQEDFMIIVPRKIVDIVKEGRALHHCVGATERYFDRIKQNETYICFLRKTNAPDEAFYTIEVEPGGTIRQHRGMYDEEPELELVKPFLKKWQKEIRKRMNEEDHKKAAVSKEKREENIKDLIARNNTRVLQGLMEDFMEAM